ncbi:hypothetical protein L7F22_053196 [Adiantum nelumboides]|uniref:Isochorismatase-family hydrolase n=1 Tax=Acaromyces ingoldii TaxID=215250 RepID=A0A316YLP8_9BASI|nr:isochorismatase-family hydrolase [Acaromyces ingoldii]MCO5599096.1 hypothetical protein [Adiantum nelumboides]PWN88993.1 isochorismatase-family hydrolase [Acaromyces ingoldii]
MTTTLDSKKTALIVLDIQPTIISMIPGSEVVIPHIVKLVDAARAKGVQIIWVTVGFNEEDWAGVSPHNKAFSGAKAAMGESLPEPFKAGGAGASLVPELKAQKGDVELRKNRFGPFSSTDLHEQLTKRGIDSIVVAGVKTSGCVLSTVRYAADHDFKIVVASDCVKDKDQAIDDVLIGKVFPEQAHVITSDEVAGLFQ